MKLLNDIITSSSSWKIERPFIFTNLNAFPAGCFVSSSADYKTLVNCQMNAFSNVAISHLGRVSSSEQTLVHFTRGWFVQSLFEINLMDFGKIGNTIQCVAIISPAQNAWIFIYKSIKCYDSKVFSTTMCWNCPGKSLIIIYLYLDTFSLERA